MKNNELEYWERFKTDEVKRKGIYPEYQRSFKIFNPMTHQNFMSLPVSEKIYARCRALRKKEHWSDIQAETLAFEWLISTFSYMCFEKLGRKVFRPQASLVNALMETDLTLPCEMIKFPFKSFYIDIPDAVDLYYPVNVGESERIIGLFVVQDALEPTARYFMRDIKNVRLVSIQWDAALKLRPEVREEQSHSYALKIALVTETINPISNGFLNGMMASTFLIKNHEDRLFEEILNETLATIKADLADYSDTEMQKVFVTISKIARIVFNLVAYLGMPKSLQDVQVKRGPISESLQKKISAHARKELLARFEASVEAEEYIIGQYTTIKQQLQEPAEPVTTERGGTPKCTHWRRGHYHRYWVGPRDSKDRHREYRWIQPILIVGWGDAPTRASFNVVK